MALWMEPGAEPTTEQEKTDLEAIAAVKVSAALEFKEKGNEYFKMGKRHYKEAIDCYTRAIDQKISDDLENSTLFANRAQVNLLLGNYRRAISDAEDAIKYNPANVKAYFRAAKAAFALDLLEESRRFCQMGLEHCESNMELKSFEKQIIAKQSEIQKQESEVSELLTKTKALVSAIERRKLKLGTAVYKELTGVKKPWLDENGVLHWPVLILYGEVMSSDFIEDFCENNSFSLHLDMLFAEDAPPLAWDVNGAYTREAIELYYQPNTVSALTRRNILKNLLEDTAGALARALKDQEGSDDETDDHNIGLSCNKGDKKWVKVNERKELLDVLRQPDYVIPGIPVFYLVSKKSSFYQDFTSGRWSPP